MIAMLLLFGAAQVDVLPVRAIGGALTTSNDGARASGASAAPGATAASVLASYDLSRTMPSFDSDGFVETMRLSGGNPHVETQRTHLESLYEIDGPDAVVDLISRLFAEELESEGREIQLQDDDEMLVSAPAEAQDRIRATIAALEATLSASVELQVDVISLPPEGGIPFAGAGIVDVGQLAGLPGGGQGRARSTYTLHLFAGRTSALDVMRTVPMIAEYDVEIAQGAAIADPVIGMAEVGTRLLVRAAPAKDGLALSVFYAHGESLQDSPVPFETATSSFASNEVGAATYYSGPSLQERLEVAFRSAAFNSFLPEGKALVMTSSLDLAGTKSREVVVLRKAGGMLPRYHRFAPPGSTREILFVNTDSLRFPEVTIEGELLGDVDYLQPIPTASAYLRFEPSTFVMDWIGSRFSTWRTLGPWIVCVYDRAWDEGAAEELEALLAGWKDATRVVDVSLAVRSKGHGGPEPVSFTLPVRAGSQCGVVMGITSTSPEDYDVEVAQFSATPDLQFAPTFNGLSFRGRPSIGGGGELGIDLFAAAQLRAGEARTVETGGPNVDRLEETTYDRLRAAERLVVGKSGAAGARFVVGDQGEGGLSLQLGVR